MGIYLLNYLGDGNIHALYFYSINHLCRTVSIHKYLLVSCDSTFRVENSTMYALKFYLLSSEVLYKRVSINHKCNDVMAAFLTHVKGCFIKWILKFFNRSQGNENYFHPFHSKVMKTYCSRER